jgi:hypothetical protein
MPMQMQMPMPVQNQPVGYSHGGFLQLLNRDLRLSDSHEEISRMQQSLNSYLGELKTEANLLK